MLRSAIDPSIFTVFVALLASAAAAQQLPVAWLASGERRPARLVAIDPEWHITLEDDAHRWTVDPDQLTCWGALAPPASQSYVVLADRSLLVADVVEIGRHDIQLDSRLFGRFKLPRSTVAAVVLLPPADLLQRDLLLRQMISPDGLTDLLLLENGDQLSGNMLRLGPGPSEIGPGGAEIAQVETRSGPMNVLRQSVVAIRFNPALVEPPRRAARAGTLGFGDGSQLATGRVARADGALQLELIAGPRLRLLPIDPARPLADIVYVRPFSRRVEYLSDLKPLGYKHIPFLALSWPYQADANVLGGQLRANGHRYEKGLGMHSAARLAYGLGGQYERFEALVAIDQLAGHRGSAVFQVFLDDGSGRWHLAAKTDVIRGGQAPQLLAVDVRGAARLALLVGFADYGDTRDYADWLSARLIRPAEER